MNALEQKLEEMRNSDHTEQEVRAGLISLELPDGDRIHYVLNEGITSEAVLNILAHSNEILHDLEMLGKEVGETGYAVFEQSSHCTFSVNHTMGESGATLYVINEEKGGIDEGARTKDNIRFTSIDLKSYRPENTMEKEQAEKSHNNVSRTRQQLAGMFLDILQSDEPLRWKKGWTVEAAGNAVTGKPYRGINRIMLALTASANGYQDHRWCTFKQASDAGWKIRKGSRGTPVEFWSIYDKKTKMTLTSREYDQLIRRDPEYKKNIRIVLREYTVFNGEQIEGIPEPEKRPGLSRPEELEGFLQRLQKEMDISIIHGGNEAFYSPSKDEIHVPVPGRFDGIYEYYSTVFHEAGHATGAEKRLNRDLTGSFGSEKYAKEELRTEIASCFLLNDLGIPSGSEEHDQNHAAYIQS